MDVYCQKCGEPWDLCEVNELTLQYDQGTAKDFRKGKGCPSCKWGKKLNNVDHKRAEMSSILFDILGDNIDGIASELDDAEYMGLFDD